MDFDDQTVGARGHGGAGERLDQLTIPRRVTRIHEHREMRPAL
jgi:hypothetical protein